MIGFATINSEGFNGTTGGNGGIITRASTLNEIGTFVHTNKDNHKKIFI